MNSTHKKLMLQVFKLNFTNAENISIVNFAIERLFYLTDNTTAMQSLVMGLGILVAILVSDVTLNNEFAYGLFFNTESGENETNDTLSIPGTETNDTLSIPGTETNDTLSIPGTETKHTVM